MYEPALLSAAVTSAPAEEPVTRSEAKAFCRVGHTDEDTLFDALIESARVAVEAWSGYALVTRTITARWRVDSLASFEVFLAYEGLELPGPPFGSLSSVATYEEGVSTAETAGNFYTRSGNPARLVLKESNALTGTDADEFEAVYTAGYGVASAVPEAFKLAIKQAVSDWYTHRSSEAVGTNRAHVLPGDARETLRSAGYKINVL